MVRQANPSSSFTLLLRSPFVFAQGEEGGFLHAEQTPSLIMPSESHLFMLSESHLFMPSRFPLFMPSEDEASPYGDTLVPEKRGPYLILRLTF